MEDFQQGTSAKNWQKPVESRYTNPLSEEIWPEMVFIEELQPKSHTSDTETRPKDSSMHENLGAGVQKKDSYLEIFDNERLQVVNSEAWYIMYMVYKKNSSLQNLFI